MNYSNLLSSRAKRALLLAVGMTVIYSGFGTFESPKAQALSATQVKAQSCLKSQFFGLEPWWQYIGNELDNSSGKCEVKCFNLTDQPTNNGAVTPNACGQSKSDIPLVLLAVVDDMLRIAAMVTIGFVLFGAFKFVSSQGDPEAAAKARGTVINALVGLALAMTAVAIVSFLGKRLGGGP